MKQRSGKMQLWVHILVTLVILGGLALAASKYLRGDEMAQAMREFQWQYAAPILIASAVYLLMKALWFGIAVNELAKQVSIVRVMTAYVAGQPATLIPGGVAARAGLLAQAGVPASVSSVPILLNSLLDTVSFLLLALISALWFEQARKPALIMLAVMIALIVALCIPPLRRGLDTLLCKLMRRFKGEEHWNNIRESLSKSATLKILGSGVVITFLAKLLLAFVLGWCLNSIGQSASLPALLLATSLPSILGRVTPSPAGAGPTEAGMVALLGSAAAISLSIAAVAVAIFRVTTVLFHALLGVLVFLTLWRSGATKSPAREPRSRRQTA